MSFLENIWRKSEEILTLCASALEGATGGAKIRVSEFSHGEFLLRGGLTVFFKEHDKEISIVVDAAMEKFGAVISVDCCMDDGEFIEIGPSLIVSNDRVQILPEKEIEMWGDALSEFCREIEGKIKRRIEIILDLS